MSAGLPIHILEPMPKNKNLTYADMLRKRTGAAKAPPTNKPDEIKERLKKIRHYTAQNLKPLLEELKTTLAEKHPGLRVVEAASAGEAVAYLCANTSGKKVVFTNNSSLVGMELRSGLVAGGFKVVNSYFNEFEGKEGRIRDYWDLPRMLQDWGLAAMFDVALSVSGPGGLMEAEGEAAEARDCALVLGVNAVSAEDGAVFFLEHFNNIRKDLAQAKDIFLVVPLEKIVKTTEDAEFQTRCVGIFGAESMLFEVQARQIHPSAIPDLRLQDMPPLASGETRTLHLIILDNQRSRILRGKYKELMLCIGCRACNQRCPVRHSFLNADFAWTPRNYLKNFIDGASKHLDTCLHCESCRLACPVGIDIPHMMWEAKLEYVAKHRRPLRHFVLGMPEVVAQAGTTFAPIMNFVLRVKPLRWVMGYIPGIHKDIVMPSFEKETFLQWAKKNNVGHHDYSNSSLLRGLMGELQSFGRRG